MKPYNALALLMVAQERFEVDYRTFCKLIPIRFLDGDVPNASQFPNDGEVWWMLTEATMQLAVPGRLVVAQLEQAPRFDPNDPTKSKVQAVNHSVREPERSDALGIVRLNASDVSNEQELVEGFRISAAMRAVGNLFVLWKDTYYGPFRTVADGGSLGTQGVQYRLLPTDAVKLTTYKIPKSDFEKIVKPYVVTVSETVSLDDKPRSWTTQPGTVRREVVLGSALDLIRSSEAVEELVMEPADTKIRRIARACLLRKSYQQFRGLLDEIELKAQDSGVDSDTLAVIADRRTRTQAELDALDNLALMMTESGLLGADRLQRVEQAIAERYLAQHGSELKARIEADTISAQKRLDDLVGREHALRAQAEAQLASQRAEQERQWRMDRQKQEDEIRAMRDGLNRERDELARSQEFLRNNLEEVTKELQTAGDQVINRFLSIEPLLGRPRAEKSRNSDAVASAAMARVQIPVTSRARVAGSDSGPQLLDESEFIARIMMLAAHNGIHIRRFDVERFHTSVKCGDITILEGPPGVGKTSLASLYGQALSGGTADSEGQCYHLTSVSPTWMDKTDLLGHVSASMGVFVPSDSGVFEFLARASVESSEHAEMARISLLCLDEMNLAQVEHYFGDIMLALERRGHDRAVACFSRSSVADCCAFRQYARLVLAPGLRVVGTVNVDETTRALSDRLLDRANVVRLVSRSSRGNSAAQVPFAESQRPVTVRDFDTWSRKQPVDPELAAFLDSLQPLLTRLNAAMSARVQAGIEAYLQRCQPVLRQEAALDAQIVQRILPRIRSINSRQQELALNDLADMITKSKLELPETSGELERKRSQVLSDDWDGDV